MAPNLTQKGTAHAAVLLDTALSRPKGITITFETRSAAFKLKQACYVNRSRERAKTQDKTSRWDGLIIDQIPVDAADPEGKTYIVIRPAATLIEEMEIIDNATGEEVKGLAEEMFEETIEEINSWKV